MTVRHNQWPDQKLVNIDKDGNVTPIDTQPWWITTDDRMNFVTADQAIYCFNGTDRIGKLEWTTYTPLDLNFPELRPKFGVEFNSSLRVSNGDNIVRKSVADNFEDFQTAGSDTFTFAESITWLKAHDDALYYFTRNTVSETWSQDIQETDGRISYFTRPLSTSEWAVNHNCIVVANKTVFYVTPTNKIVVIAKWQWENGADTVQLSDRKGAGITKLMKRLDPDQSKCFGYYVWWDNLIKRHFRSIGSQFNDVCVVYNTELNKFMVDTQKFFSWWVNDWVFNYTISDLEPKVYLDEYGQDDEDTPIPFEYRTKNMYLWQTTFKKILWETRTLLDVTQLTHLEQAIYIDWEHVHSYILDKSKVSNKFWGIGVWGIGTGAIGTWWKVDAERWYQETYILITKWNLNLKWTKIQFRFTNNSLAGRVRLKDVEIKQELLPAIATNLI